MADEFAMAVNRVCDLSYLTVRAVLRCRCGVSRTGYEASSVAVEDDTVQNPTGGFAEHRWTTARFDLLVSDFGGLGGGEMYRFEKGSDPVYAHVWVRCHAF